MRYLENIPEVQVCSSSVVNKSRYVQVSHLLVSSCLLSWRDLIAPSIEYMCRNVERYRL